MYRLGMFDPMPVEVKIKRVIYNPPATIVFWSDDTKTVVKCAPDDTFDPEKGLAMAYAKRAEENDPDFYQAYLKKWVPKNDGQYAKPKLGKKKSKWAELWPNGRITDKWHDYGIKDGSLVRITDKKGTVVEGPARGLHVDYYQRQMWFLTGYVGTIAMNIFLDGRIESFEIEKVDE